MHLMAFFWLLKKLHSWKKPKRSPGALRHKMNLKADPRDEKDVKYAFKSAVSETKIPDVYEIPLKFQSPVKNQGRVGSCASHAAADLVEIEFAINKPNRLLPLSELWHYYTVRSPEYFNTFPADSGQYARDMCRVLKDKGIAPEMTWPYDVSKFNDSPPWYANAFAGLYKIKSYHRIYSVADIRKSIALDHPVAVGFKLFQKFLSFKGTVLPMPEKGERMVGGHEMIIVGYNKPNKTLRIKNSWGARWGDSGYVEIPEAYFLLYALDYWSVRV